MKNATDRRNREWSDATAFGSAGASAGAATVATAAAACCAGPVVSPLIVGLLGAGGAAWAAGLEPYAPYLLVTSGALVGYAIWTLRPRRVVCDVNAPPDPAGRRWLRRSACAVTALAAVLWLGAVILNWVVQ